MSEQMLEALKRYHEQGWDFNFTYDGTWHVAACHKSFGNYVPLPQADGSTPEEAFNNLVREK